MEQDVPVRRDSFDGVFREVSQHRAQIDLQHGRLLRQLVAFAVAFGLLYGLLALVDSPTSLIVIILSLER